MTVLSSNSVFTSLQQNGPFAVPDSVRDAGRFSSETRQWVRRLQEDPNNIAKYRALCSQIFEFLAVENIEQIQSLIGNKKLSDERSERA